MNPFQGALFSKIVPNCKKLGLLDRAVKEGDERALVALQIAKACFKKSHSVDEASKKLRARLDAEGKAKKGG